MKYVLFTLFVFCIHLSMAIYNATGLFAYGTTPDSSFLDSFNTDALKSASYTTSQIDQNQDVTAGDYIKATAMFVVTLGLGVFVVPYTLSLLGLTYPYTLYFSLVVYFMYLLAILQIISKDSYSGKQ